MKRAFTLIELLVVIAIIAILAAILFPVFAQAKEAAKKTVCLSNMKQIMLGMLMYTNDNDDMTIPILPNETGINGGDSGWTPYDSMIRPYVKNDQIYKCPDDPGGAVSPSIPFWDGSYRNKALKRSYSIIGPVVTFQARGLDSNTGFGLGPDGSYTSSGQPINSDGRSDTSFSDPSETTALVEDWINFSETPDSWVGDPWGSAAIGCDYSEFAGRQYPPKSSIDVLPPLCADRQTDIPAPGHNNASNYGFVDGHAKLMRWAQFRHNDFFVTKVDKPTIVVSP